jgi:alkaline phosphatase
MIPEASHWNNKAKAELATSLNLQKLLNNGQAKNVILFLGDGMSIPTLTAARILKGKLDGSAAGEEATLEFEKFPHVGLSKVTFLTCVHIH